jgi:hypothetical protein
MTAEDGQSSRVLDPLLNLSVPSPATSLCFVGTPNNNQHGSNSSGADDSDSDSSEDLSFRSSRLAKGTSGALEEPAIGFLSPER